MSEPYQPPVREVATHAEDRPHAFEATTHDMVCRLCRAGATDERHVRYEELSRQRASSAVPPLTFG